MEAIKELKKKEVGHSMKKMRPNTGLKSYEQKM